MIKRSKNTLGNEHCMKRIEQIQGLIPLYIKRGKNRFFRNMPINTLLIWYMSGTTNGVTIKRPRIKFKKVN